MESRRASRCISHSQLHVSIGDRRVIVCRSCDQGLDDNSTGVSSRPELTYRAERVGRSWPNSSCEKNMVSRCFDLVVLCTDRLPSRPQVHQEVPRDREEQGWCTECGQRARCSSWARAARWWISSGFGRRWMWWWRRPQGRGGRVWGGGSAAATGCWTQQALQS